MIDFKRINWLLVGTSLVWGTYAFAGGSNRDDSDDDDISTSGVLRVAPHATASASRSGPSAASHVSGTSADLNTDDSGSVSAPAASAHSGSAHAVPLAASASALASDVMGPSVSVRVPLPASLPAAPAPAHSGSAHAAPLAASASALASDVMGPSVSVRVPLPTPTPAPAASAHSGSVPAAAVSASALVTDSVASASSSVRASIEVASSDGLDDFLRKQNYIAAFASLKTQVGHLSNGDIVEFLLRSNGYDMDHWGRLSATRRGVIIERLSDGLDDLLSKQNYGEAYSKLRATLGNQVDAADIVKFLVISNGYNEAMWGGLSLARRQEIVARVTFSSFASAAAAHAPPSQAPAPASALGALHAAAHAPRPPSSASAGAVETHNVIVETARLGLSVVNALKGNGFKWK